MLMTLVYIWFGCGAFVAVVNFLQWCLDGYNIGEGPEDPYFWLNGMLQNVVSGFFLGPIILVIQISMGMPIFPQRKG